MSTPLHLLIITDSADDAAMLLQTLRDGGYEPLWERVDTVTAMASALDRHPWELVLFASLLPCFSAMTALKLLQERGLDLPFLILAEESSEESAVVAMKAGAHDYVMKDNLVRLVPAIERELREARTRRAYYQTRHQFNEHTDRQGSPLRNQAVRDVLAEVSPCIVFHDHLQQTLLAAQQKHKLLALLLISFNRFQEIVKTFGHQWGEALFQQAGARFHRSLRKSDTLVRVDGDKYAVLLPPGGDVTAAMLVAQRILRALEQPFVIEGHALIVGANIGIALYPEHGTDAQTLMRRADVATDIAARTSSGYALYTTEHDRYSRERLLLVSELHAALKRDQLLLHYQPKAHMATGQVNHVEALVRWQHPRHGLLLPEQFLALAEQTGLIRSLSFWVLSTVIHQCRVWQQAGLELCVAINFSLQHDLQDAQLPETVARLLQVCDVAPTCLEVEITENPVAENPKQALATLTRFRDMGIRIAIDDFGTGYSSLVYLKQLPVDEIKIDKSLVIGMTKDANSAAIVRSTIDLGHDLGLQVAAEGVEDQATWDMLADFGCDFAQGYHLSRPVSAAVLTQWLKESSWGKGLQSDFPPARRRKLRRRRDAAIGEF